MTTISVDNIPDKTRDAGKAMIAAVPQSVSIPAKKAYEKVSGSVQWYLEQWEDVIEEAKEMRGDDLENISLTDFLTFNLPEANVVSEIPGRLRVRAKELKGRKQLAKQCTEALAELDGINEVHVSALTGSVLVFFDEKQYETRDALMQAIG